MQPTATSSLTPGRSGPCAAARAAAVALALALGAAPAAADPRWWWDDQRVTFTNGDSVQPHLVVPGYQAGGNTGGIYVTWAEVDPAGGDLEIWMTGSFDGGCSFCPPTRLTDNDVDDTNPRIAVLSLPEGFNSFAIAYEENAASGAGKAVIAWDSTSMSYRVPQDQFCPELAEVGPNVLLNDQHVRFGADGFAADQADVVSVSSPTFAHFHAVWRDGRNGEGDIYHAHDPTARGGLGWRIVPEKNLTSDPATSPLCDRPQVACDIFTDPDPVSGLATRDRAGVNVVFAEHGDFGFDRLSYLRSVDSGLTFSATGERVDGPAGTVHDLLTQGDLRPTIDAAGTSFSFEQPLWLATAWDDVTDPAGERLVSSNARFLDTPITALPDWQVAPPAVQVASRIDDGDPSISLRQSFGGARIPGWVAWEEHSPNPVHEIQSRAGVLDTVAASAVDWTTHPFAPVRSFDTATSSPGLLSHCVHGDVSRACEPTRTVGDAVDVELAADFQDFHAVWSDSRDGNREIYYKRTDQFLNGTTSRLVTGCQGPGKAWVDATFDLVDTCPLNRERMRRYFVYYGTDPGGPFVNWLTPVIVPHDPGLGSVVTVRFTDLAPATTYQFLVVPEDEARNLAPADIERTYPAAAAYPTEQSITTPPDCVPAVAASCGPPVDACPSVPAIDGDGSFDFGEQVTVEIRVTASGASPLTDYTARIVVTGATLAPPGSDVIALARVAAGETAIVSRQLQLPARAAAACGDPVTLALVDQQSDGGLPYPDDPLVECSFVLGDPSDPLHPCAECALFPDVRVTRCGIVSDACGSGTPPPNGAPDPGDDIVLEIELTNIGTNDATNVVGLVRLGSGATAVDPLDLAVPLLPAGRSQVVTVRLRVTGACGDLVDVDVLDLASDGGAFTFPDHAGCDTRIGANPTPVSKTYQDDWPFGVPDAGVAQSPVGLAPVDAVRVDRATIRIEGSFPNLPNLAAELVNAAGLSVDVTAALNATLDVTGAYNGPLGGPGPYDIRVRELVSDPANAFVQRWILAIDDTVADCEPCVEQACLHRVDVSSLFPHVPGHAAVYVSPRTPDDLGIRSTQVECPWTDDRVEPFEPAPLSNGVALQVYQVNLATDTLRLAKDGATIRFRF